MADNIWENWQNRLIMGDVGAATAAMIIQDLRQCVGDQEITIADCQRVISRRLRRLEAMLSTEGQQPCVIVTMGVNGCGKTTTIAKLSRRFLTLKKTVLLAAGDTFRAAAREQLAQWATTLGGLDMISGTGDPAAVAFNAVKSGIARGVDIVLIDTAGRLPTQAHLMAELNKICRAVSKALPGAPHELLLILDATTGQNALSQISAFSEAFGVTGTIITKLDGSSKGGFLLAMAEQHPLPVRFVGVGEGSDDLALFDSHQYAAALMGETEVVT